MGNPSKVDVMMAWAHVGIRVAHSLVQTLVNEIEVRFSLFVLSNVPLFVLTHGAAMQLLTP
jgi:hypothetical protein